MNGESGPNWIIVLVAAGILVELVIFIVVWLKRYRKVPPNAALIVSGRGPRESTRVVTSGGSFIWPVFEEAHELSLEIIPVALRSRQVVLPSGGRTDVEAEAQVKVGSDRRKILSAAERFLSKTREQISEIVQGVLDPLLQQAVADHGPDRGSVETVMKSRAQEALRPLGLELVSFAMEEMRIVDGTK